MNFQQLQCFVTVSDTLNFSTAAKRLHLSQPAVSKNIKQLETELAFELFKRNQHGVALTPAGLEFSKQMANVLILTEQAIIDSREISEQAQQSLTIGYTNAVIENKLLPKLLENARHQLSTVRLSIRSFDLSTGLSNLQRGIFDLILATRDSLGDNPEIEFVPLVQGHFNVILPIGHRLSDHKRLDFSELEKSQLIFFNPMQAPPESATLQNVFLQSPGNTRYQTADTINTAINLVKGGAGLAILPSFTVDPVDSNVMVVPLDYPVTLDYGVAYLRSNTSTPLLTLVDLIKALIGKIS
ncbi:Hca operon transcriptional activator [Lentilactobacillus sunkii]|uniref:Hca operon transcriptional activator n=1 Tax=Lentilactobacillus sunkii TaxID=481719 RepID=A0A1E7XE86_9LACO|nr:LysR substrate-binding domain-containing protein [Lentilactobacillus sunkii]OFA11435.1 Hca operon transcriptional activator [Lentilactobacillus sunkii]